MALSPPRLDGVEVALAGSRRGTERYTAEELAGLADNHVLQKLSMYRQDITALPPLPASLEELRLGDMKGLVSLAGIERLVRLRVLWLVDLGALALPQIWALIAELPELAELRIVSRLPVRFPDELVKLPSLIDLALEIGQLDLVAAIPKLGPISTLRRLALKQSVWKLDADLAPLARLEALALEGVYDPLPPQLRQLASLTTLDLSQSRVTTLPDEIGELANLVELKLPQTIQRLPDSIVRCTNLETLDALGSIKLLTLPEDIGSLANLRVVKLPYNTTLPESFYRLTLHTYLGPDGARKRLALLPAPP